MRTAESALGQDFGSSDYLREHSLFTQRLTLASLENQLERNLHLSGHVRRGSHRAEIGAIDDVARGSEYYIVESVKCFKPERERHSFANRKSSENGTIEISKPIRPQGVTSQVTECIWRGSGECSRVKPLCGRGLLKSGIAHQVYSYKTVPYVR